MYKGWKSLTAKERKHLREAAGVLTTVDLEATFLLQAKLRTDYSSEPCYECKAIADKLGYPLYPVGDSKYPEKQCPRARVTLLCSGTEKCHRNRCSRVTAAEGVAVK